MRSRSGFARLLPLALVTGLIGGFAFMLFWGAWEREKEAARVCDGKSLRQLSIQQIAAASLMYSQDYGGGRSDVPERVPVRSEGARGATGGVSQ